MKNLIAQAIPKAVDFNKLNHDLITTVAPSLNPKLVGGAGEIFPLFSQILTYVYVIAGLVLLFHLVSGGFQMMTGASEEKKITEAKSRITNALVGFLILFLSYWLVQIIEYIFGIQIF